jgi:hypothetical protein
MCELEREFWLWVQYGTSGVLGALVVGMNFQMEGFTFEMSNHFVMHVTPLGYVRILLLYVEGVRSQFTMAR